MIIGAYGYSRVRRCRFWYLAFVGAAPMIVFARSGKILVLLTTRKLSQLVTIYVFSVYFASTVWLICEFVFVPCFLSWLFIQFQMHISFLNYQFDFVLRITGCFLRERKTMRVKWVRVFPPKLHFVSVFWWDAGLGFWSRLPDEASLIISKPFVTQAVAIYHAQKRQSFILSLGRCRQDFSPDKAVTGLLQGC